MNMSQQYITPLEYLFATCLMLLILSDTCSSDMLQESQLYVLDVICPCKLQSTRCFSSLPSKIFYLSSLAGGYYLTATLILYLYTIISNIIFRILSPFPIFMGIHISWCAAKPCYTIIILLGRIIHSCILLLTPRPVL